MSFADDFECIAKIVQQSEKFICGEIAKVQKELKTCTESQRVCETKIKEQDAKIQKLESDILIQDQKITILQTENQSLLEQIRALQGHIDNPNVHSACASAMQRAFASALQTLLPASNVPTMTLSPTDISVIYPLAPEPISNIEVTSTPQQQEATQVPLPVSDDPSVYKASRIKLGKRKITPESSATSQIYTEMNSLPSEFKKRLEPFAKDNKCSTRDKLNTVQRAFVKYKVNELKQTGQRVGETFILRMIQEGVANRIWAEDFKPSTDFNLFHYMLNRIKNEKKIIAREELLKTTNERVASYLNEANIEIEEDVIEEGDLERE